jgi:hypothetical protein
LSYAWNSKMVNKYLFIWSPENPHIEAKKSWNWDFVLAENAEVCREKMVGKQDANGPEMSWNLHDTCSLLHPSLGNLTTASLEQSVTIPTHDCHHISKKALRILTSSSCCHQFIKPWLCSAYSTSKTFWVHFCVPKTCEPLARPSKASTICLQSAFRASVIGASFSRSLFFSHTKGSCDVIIVMVPTPPSLPCPPCAFSLSNP